MVDVAAAGARRLRDRDERDAHDSRVPGGGLRPRGSGLAEGCGDRSALLPPGVGGAAHRRCVQGQGRDGVGAEDNLQRPGRAHGRRRLGADLRPTGGTSSPELTF